MQAAWPRPDRQEAWPQSPGIAEEARPPVAPAEVGERSCAEPVWPLQALQRQQAQPAWEQHGLELGQEPERAPRLWLPEAAA